MGVQECLRTVKVSISPALLLQHTAWAVFEYHVLRNQFRCQDLSCFLKVIVCAMSLEHVFRSSNIESGLSCSFPFFPFFGANE